MRKIMFQAHSFLSHHHTHLSHNFQWALCKNEVVFDKQFVWTLFKLMQKEHGENKFNRISFKKLVDLLVDGYIFLILATIIVQESFFYFKTKCLQSDCKSNFSYFISFHCWFFFFLLFCCCCGRTRQDWGVVLWEGKESRKMSKI